MSLPQSLIKRKPTITEKEFSDHWYNNHAPIVVPYFLSHGIQYYTQIHGPLSVSISESDSSLTISDWDGAAEIQRGDSTGTGDEQWKSDYYREVILQDELGFLISEAGTHYLRVEPGRVEGERRVIIRDGKSEIQVPEEVIKVWREYEKRGEVGK